MGSYQSMSVPTNMNSICLSVCIVTFEARDLLAKSLHSLAKNTRLDYEVIVVDNGSTDQVGEMLQEQFPYVKFHQNGENLGYTRPMNQALKRAKGQFLLQLNPDTLILPDALDTLVAFMQEHPDAGICGPKVLNPDHSLQKPCRRGEPTPGAVFSYFLGLHKLFPDSKRFGGYLLNYLDENQTNEVAGVSGSCMLVRRDVINQIGYLDELFFAYQEDADFCRRTREAGWQVFYVPQAQIIHYGSLGGSRVQPFRSIYEWHRSYYLYYRKHLSKDYPLLFNLFYYLIMFLKFSISIVINLFRKRKYAGPRDPIPGDNSFKEQN